MKILIKPDKEGRHPKGAYDANEFVDYIEMDETGCTLPITICSESLFKIFDVIPNELEVSDEPTEGATEIYVFQPTSDSNIVIEHNDKIYEPMCSLECLLKTFNLINKTLYITIIQ